MKNTKISLMLIGVSMTILVFTGCNMRSSTKTPMNNTNQTTKSISIASMKTLYSNTLKELVTANTITNAQSKKVLATITKNMSQVSITNSSNAATPNAETTGTKGTTETPGATGSSGSTPSTGTAGTTGTTGAGTTNSTNKIETTNDTNIINGLNSLVKSKVITQVQADTIQQKIQMKLENMQINK